MNYSERMKPGTMVKALLESGLNQYELAKKVGKSQPTIYRLAHGLQKSTDYETVDRLRQLHAELIERAA